MFGFGKNSKVSSQENSGQGISEAEKRKQRSIAILKEQNVPYMEGLPCIETKDECLIRTKEEIAKRAIATIVIIQLACDIQNDTDDLEGIREFVVGVLERFNVMDELTENEKKILTLDVSWQELVNMVWKYEAYWSLLWALGLVEELDFPSGICDCDFAARVVFLEKSFESFMEKVKLRSIDEILDEADLIFRYDWACVDARIKGENAPANMDSSVVLERHKGLNWLIGTYGSEDWDTVQANT